MWTFDGEVAVPLHCTCYTCFARRYLSPAAHERVMREPIPESYGEVRDRLLGWDKEQR